ncbi:MAG: toll/interleukin-1 receptor domain-containing protein, partial [Chloroflexi bacterium]
MSSNQPVKKPIEILFSYAREDEKLRDELEKGLSVLKRQNRIVCWHDRQISGGDPWEQAISSHLDTADIILLLVSRAFIASDYSNRVEVRYALERHEKGEVRVIPVILRQCDWHDEPFAKLQA